MNELERMSAWIEDVYLPKLRARDHEMVFDGTKAWESGDRFSERFLQILWNERYVTPDLQTVSGKPLRIVHPGTWNVSSGPDFRDGSLTLDGRLVRGDVEIHQRSSDWLRHGHGEDSAYDGVVLHVVWEDDGPIAGGPPETLVLQGHLPPAWHLLLQDVEDACYPYARQVSAGQCAVRWALADDAALQTVLASAGLARLSAKADRLARQCAEYGADQAVYELFFDCLGYRQNRQAFRELAVLVPLETLRKTGGGEAATALLFGTAGLLPDPTRETVLPEWEDTVAALWRSFWEQGGQTGHLPWCYGGTRPFNSPQRRLAAGAAWLERTGYQPAAWLRSLGEAHHDPKTLLKTLLTPMADNGPWLASKNFQVRLRHAAALLGQPRLKDIAANLVLPFFVSLEQTDGGSSGGLADLAREAFVLLAPGQENRTLTEAAHRFLTPPSRAQALLKRYCHQQGLLDIYRNFCVVLGADCASCPFGAH